MSDTTLVSLWHPEIRPSETWLRRALLWEDRIAVLSPGTGLRAMFPQFSTARGPARAALERYFAYPSQEGEPDHVPIPQNERFFSGVQMDQVGWSLQDNVELLQALLANALGPLRKPKAEQSRLMSLWVDATTAVNIDEYRTQAHHAATTWDAQDYATNYESAGEQPRNGWDRLAAAKVMDVPQNVLEAWKLQKSGDYWYAPEPVISAALDALARYYCTVTNEKGEMPGTWVTTTDKTLAAARSLGHAGPRDETQVALALSLCLPVPPDDVPVAYVAAFRAEHDTTLAEVRARIRDIAADPSTPHLVTKVRQVKSEVTAIERSLARRGKPTLQDYVLVLAGAAVGALAPDGAAAAIDRDLSSVASIGGLTVGVLGIGATVVKSLVVPSVRAHNASEHLKESWLAVLADDAARSLSLVTPRG